MFSLCNMHNKTKTERKNSHLRKLGKMVRVKILLYARDKTSLGHKLNFTKKKKYQDISTAQ